MKIKVSDIVFSVNSEYRVDITEKDNSNDILELSLEVETKEKCVPEKVEINWSVDCCDMFSQWHPMQWNSPWELEHNFNPGWRPTKMTSKITQGVPVQTFLSHSGYNRMTIALSDVIMPVQIATGICEDDGTLKCTLTLFNERVSPIKRYSAVLLIDRRNIPYYDCIYDAVKWWDDIYDCHISIPAETKGPLYSTWYTYHQKLDAQCLIEQLKAAREMGMKTVIIDDGWQTDDSSGGYAYCGDWRVTPRKIPDIKKFVKDIHTLGMKVILWFAVPYIGKYAEKYELFKDKLLNGSDREYSCLDIRYFEVRNYLTKIYKKAHEEWGVDGFKLDFIDAFALSEDSAEQNDLMDCDSVENAIYKLLEEIHDTLNTDDFEPLIEFRQNYIGPIMRKFGNMLRVADVPDDPLLHRARAVNLRYTSGKTPVHSDMLMWNKNEPAENTALQIANVLFTVPQISVDINSISAEQKETLWFYLDFWTENKDCILDGKLAGLHPESNFSLVYSAKEKECIIVSYSDNFIRLENSYEQICLVNATDSETFILDEGLAGIKKVKVFDCRGREIKDIRAEKLGGRAAINIPVGGIAKILY